MTKRDQKELRRYIRWVADTIEYATDALASAIAKHMPKIVWPE